MLLAAARSIFCEKCDAKSELEHENHERGILKLAFLKHVRITIQPKQLFCIWLGQCQPGGMRGGAGGRLEGGLRSADLNLRIEIGRAGWPPS